MPETFKDDKGRTRYIAECCGAELSKSGYYKHTAKPCPKSKREAVESSSSPRPNTDSESTPDTPAPSPSSWLSWEPESVGTGTESLPTPLKFIASRGTVKGQSKEDLEALMGQSRAILALGLTAWDSLATRYAKAVTEDEEYLISHSEEEKALVADAQARWLESRGLLVAEIVGEGALAAALTGFYIIPPLAKAQAKAKRGLVSPLAKGKAVVFLGKIPLIGRIFRRKPKRPVITVPEENTTEGWE